MTDQTAGSAAWRVTSQQETREQDVTGNYADGWRIYFTTGAGHNGSVFVPVQLYQPARIADLIGQAAANIDAIGNLTG